MGNIVLVYGAWGDQWAWELVAPGLVELGHEVRTPDLHRGSLAADTAAVQAVVDELGGPVLAAGWSYGGAVITGLRLPAGSHLLYIAALVPDADESLGLLMQTFEPSALFEVVEFREDGTMVLPEDKATAPLWPDAPPEVAARAAAGVASRPQVMSVDEAPGRTAWREVASTYLLCQRDQAILPADQRRMAARATDVVEWDCSHSPPLSRPTELVALIDKLASALPAS